MTFQSQENLKEAKRWLVLLEAAMKIDGHWKHLDSAIEFEPFSARLLNKVYGWSLERADFGTKSQDSFDLVDNAERIAVQVTVTQGAAKVRKTLRTFIGEHDSNYERLIIFYPWQEPRKITADLSNDLHGYSFDPKKDCFGMDEIAKKIQAMDINGQQAILELFARELKPLAKPSFEGVDKTVETLIKAIEYMSENAPEEEIDFEELSPDQAAKIARLGEAAERRMRNRVIQAQFHPSVQAARDAVGIDPARVEKIQCWLQVKSLEALAESRGDVDQALETMGAELLAAAHSSGTDAEDMAVQFLLADEMISCNVFPNPAPSRTP